MRKLIAVIVLLMFLASNFAVAIAENEGSGNGTSSGNMGSDDDSDDANDDDSDEDDDSDDDSDETNNTKNVRKIKIKERVEILKDKTEDKYNRCMMACKGNQGEDCNVRCRGLIKSAEKISNIQEKLGNIRAERIEILKDANRSSLSEDDLEKLVQLDRARLKELAKLSDEKLKGELKRLKLVKVKEENLAKRRIIAEEKLKDWKNAFEKAKEKFKENNELYKEKKETFNEVKEKLKACKDQDTEECKKLNEEALSRGKEFLLKTADLAIEHLNKIKAKAESSDTLTEEEVKEISEKIDNAIKELEDAKAKVSGATSKEELQDAAKAINNAWKRIKYNSMEYAVRIVNARVGEIIKRSENLERKMQCAVEQMGEQNASTDEVNSLIDEFSGKIGSARDKYDNAKELLKQAREIKANGDSSDEEDAKVKDLVEKAKQQFSEAHNDLKEAHELLKKILAIMKESNVNVGECKSSGLNEGEVYAVEEVSEESIGEVTE